SSTRRRVAAGLSGMGAFLAASSDVVSRRVGYVRLSFLCGTLASVSAILAARSGAAALHEMRRWLKLYEGELPGTTGQMISQEAGSPGKRPSPGRLESQRRRGGGDPRCGRGGRRRGRIAES